VYCWHKPNGQGNNPARGTTKWEPILSWNTVQDKQTDFIEHNNEYGEKINTLHLTPKPIGLIEKIIKKTDGIIVDLFLGSGTTMLASQNLSRQCRAVEISPEYCSVILERMSEAFPALEIKRIE
jgi:DNA modification methylase